MEISYSPNFVRMFKALSEALQEEIVEKIELLKDHSNGKMLKVHKLSSRLRGRFSFSVNYKTRIVFIYLSEKPQKVYLLAVGDHDVYDR